MRIVLVAAAGIALVVALVLVLPHGSDSVPEPGPAAAPPAPPADALVLAREDGRLAVGLAVRGRELTATVLAPDGGAWHGPLAFSANGRKAKGAPCGVGCYRATIAHGRTVTVRPGDSAVTFRLPAHAPPPAGALVRRAARTFRGLRSVTLDERIASGSGHVVRTRFVIAAPNRLTYRQPGSEAVVIGKRRWDRIGKGPWEQSAQSPIEVPAPFWDGRFTNARLLSRSNGVATVVFFTPRLPAWYEARIDERTGRTLDATMVAASHFMHHRYSRFNAPVHIAPPR